MKITLNNFKHAYNLIKNSSIILRTALERNNRLSEKYGCNIYFKREDLQISRSFKIRGAYNKIMNQEHGLGHKNMITASAGNMAQGFSITCSSLKLDHHIFLPTNTPLQKINKIKYFGKDYLKLHLVGKTFDESCKAAKRYGEENDFIFVHPFDDKDVIVGQGTIGIEIYEDIKPDMIIIPVGGGGLISGIGSYSKLINPDCLICGVEPENANSMKVSLRNNKITSLKMLDTFVDGASVKTCGELTFNICKNVVDNILEVSNNKLCYHIIDIYQNDGIILEPAGCLSISVLDQLNPSAIKNKSIVCVLSGGNNDISRYPEILEKSLQYQELKHYFLIKFSQTPGELRRYINNILGPSDDITRFEYLKKTNKSHGTVLIGIVLQDKNSIYEIIEKMESFDFEYTKITENSILYSYIL